MMKEENSIEHPSFGLISIARTNCSETIPLFGSSIPHRSFIRIDIHNAILYRDLNRDWIHQKGVPIVSIELSMTQFAEAMTSLNTEGTPCTITFMEGHAIPEPVFQNKRIQIDNEFKDKMIEIAENTNTYYAKIQELLTKESIGKKDKVEIMKQLELLQAQIANTLPFIKKQFTEQMDKTVLEAKNEFDAFVDNKLRRSGLTNYRKELAALTFTDSPLPNKKSEHE
jgi:hypothetical protein